MRLIDADGMRENLLWCKEQSGSYNDVYWDDVIERLDIQPTVIGWISVKDRLPEKYETVLVAVAGRDVIIQRDGESLEEAINRTFREVRYVTIGSIDEEGDWNGPEGYPMMVQPRFWMPLPELPQEGDPE